MNARTRTKRRAAPILGGVALLAALLATVGTAAPSYTDWSEPVSLGPVVNSPIVPGSTGRDTAPALSQDELSLYFDSDRPGGFGGRDFWVSKRATVNDAWGTPVNLGPTVNSPLLDAQPSLSPDGHWLFFTSTRAGGLGGQDMYRSFRADIHDDLAWQAPISFGPSVNGPANDNSPGYFENPGGLPQVIFSSDRIQAGNSDWYMTELRVDGSWSSPTSLPELNSPFNEGRPSVSRDGLELYFQRGIAAGLSSTDLWRATRASVADPWSTPVNVGPPVNGAATDQDAFLSADGRTLLFDSNRPTDNRGFEMYMSTRDAKLTVTANDRSRLFGQANPTLTYATSGFVGGEDASVVTGTAACTTTAIPSSAAGIYPISCAAGTLAAPRYTFATFVPATLTVGYSRPCLSVAHTGSLTVGAGEAVCIAAGGAQTGPVTVQPGGSLDVEGGRITGPVHAAGAAAVRICGAAITGPLTITGSTGPVLAGGAACDPNTIVGSVTLTGNSGGIELNGNRVVGPLRITGNTPVVHATGNSVTGSATIQS